MEYMHLGHRIQQAREGRNLTREQLAEKMAVKAKTVRQWESEQKIPRVNKLNTMAGVLDVPILWLLAGSDTLPESQPSPETVEAVINDKLQLAEKHLSELNTLLHEVKALSLSKN
ncbi:MAG: helix-turn-helix transcriptional regulator [Thiolinea sp.]